MTISHDACLTLLHGHIAMGSRKSIIHVNCNATGVNFTSLMPVSAIALRILLMIGRAL